MVARRIVLTRIAFIALSASLIVTLGLMAKLSNASISPKVLSKRNLALLVNQFGSRVDCRAQSGPNKHLSSEKRLFLGRVRLLLRKLSEKFVMI